MWLIILQGTGSEKGARKGKRAGNDDVGLFVAVTPTGIPVHWGRGVLFGIPSCRNAFSCHSPCNFAFCPACKTDQTNILVGTNSGSKRNRRNDGKRSAAAVTGGDKGGDGDCPRHTIRDVLALDHTMQVKAHLSEKRKKDEGWENIATDCVFCGKRF